jgi:transcriptional regulator with XRE-family HTH domain
VNFLYDKFRQLIDARGLTPYRVAKDTEIPSSMFYDWKQGRYNPKLDKLQKIATYLGVKIEDLVE